MNTLFKISKYSTFTPDSGELKDLYELVQEGLERKTIFEHWKSQGKSSDHFRHIYKNLKDELLEHAFKNPKKKQLTVFQKKRIDCWKKFATVKGLLIAKEVTTANVLAAETLALAEKYSLLEIRLSLSMDLLYYHSVLSPDRRKHLRYRRKLKEAKQDVDNYAFVIALLSELNFNVEKKKNIDSLKNNIECLRKISSDEIGFNTLRYYTLSFWFRCKNNYDVLVEVCQKAIQFFSGQEKLYSSIRVWSYYNQLIPLHIANGKFDEAEKLSNLTISLAQEGSLNWHNSLFHRTLIGFYSDKPKMALAAYQKAQKLKNHNNTQVDERWMLVDAYLAVYEILGRLKIDKRFRLKKFLNSVPNFEGDKKAGNVSIIIVELLLLLLKDNKKLYMKKVEKIPIYTHKYLRDKEYKRARSILHMFLKVENGNYYKTRTNLKAQKWLRILRQNPCEIASSEEMIPYEKVWEIVLSQLK